MAPSVVLVGVADGATVWSGSEVVSVPFLVVVPERNFFGNRRPRGRLFLWLRRAQTKDFSEGEKFLGQSLAAPFWILAAIGGFDLATS